jgi:hypothetical protein
MDINAKSLVQFIQKWMEALSHISVSSEVAFILKLVCLLKSQLCLFLVIMLRTLSLFCTSKQETLVISTRENIKGLARGNTGTSRFLL